MRTAATRGAGPVIGFRNLQFFLACTEGGLPLCTRDSIEIWKLAGGGAVDAPPLYPLRVASPLTPQVGCGQLSGGYDLHGFILF